MTTSGDKIVAVQENGSTHFLAPLTVPGQLDACIFQIYAGEIGGCLPPDCAKCSMCSGAPKSAHERLSTLDK